MDERSWLSDVRHGRLQFGVSTSHRLSLISMERDGGWLAMQDEREI
jgi:hypothetical protein